MKKIFFPTSYKKALLTGSKNTTVRINDEIDKYKKEEIYKAFSYAGNDWDVNVKIDKVSKIKIKDLPKFGIPKKSFDSFKKKVGELSENYKVDLIKFHSLTHKDEKL